MTTPADWTQIDAPEVTYHATMTSSAASIAWCGIRSIDSAWGAAGGRLGNGFYTHQDGKLACEYVADVNPVLLRFKVTPCKGSLAPTDHSLWLGEWSRDAYDAVNVSAVFLAFTDPSGLEMKFNSGGYLTLEAMSDDRGDSYLSPFEWLQLHGQGNPAQ
ncbi:hypothetical protein ACFYPT_41515 [Streptomyces sp. NPDC005529]|uniref:hypothetical protein n=1 Tax=unclassified Streptomyces TaxID=2593676 RepID=UPI0033B863A5